jgi:hypothetical protein
MVNGKLTKAEKRRRAQQSNRDRSSRGQNNNNNMGTPLASTQTRTIMTLASMTPKTATKEEATAGNLVRSWVIGGEYIPALKLALTGVVSWRIRSCQAYLIPTMPDSSPALLGLLVTPEKWNVKTLADLQTCGGTISKSTVSKISSNTIGAETEWRPANGYSQYQVWFGCSRNPDPPIEIGALEFRIVIETRGIGIPA